MQRLIFFNIKILTIHLNKLLNKIQKFYFVTENREPLGFQQKNDPALAKFMIDWMARAKESQLYKMLGIMDASQRYELWAKYPNNGPKMYGW